MRTGDTIAAVSSCPGWSPRAVIRVSGEDAFRIIDLLLSGNDAEHDGIEHDGIERGGLEQGGIERGGIERGGIERGGIERGGRGVRCGRIRVGGSFLPCILAYFPGPDSYTAEDTVEILTTGNIHLLNRILQACYQEGARPAEAGEFTFRAYANGRLTLAQAEGVAATIAAVSDAQLRAARLLTEGSLGRICRLMSERLSRALALVEAGIDFVDEEDIVPITGEALVGEAGVVLDEIDSLTEHSVGMEQLSALPRVVLTGPPNAGKSTLFNALLGRSRAVVSVRSGTTRDVLAEPMHLDPEGPLSAEILLTDIAGLHHGDIGDAVDPFNSAMQESANRAIEDADLIVDLYPADGNEADRPILLERVTGILPGVPVIRVLSKCDDGEESAGLLSGYANDNDRVNVSCVGAECDFDCSISAKTGYNLDLLRARIGTLLRERTTSLAGDAIALTPRHTAALAEARNHLKRLTELLTTAESRYEAEIVAYELRMALQAVVQITGEAATPDDILGRIFSTFCIGK